MVFEAKEGYLTGRAELGFRLWRVRNVQAADAFSVANSEGVPGIEITSEVVSQPARFGKVRLFQNLSIAKDWSP